MQTHPATKEINKQKLSESKATLKHFQSEDSMEENAAKGRQENGYGGGDILAGSHGSV